MQVIVIFGGWVYNVDVEYYQPEVLPVPCSNHDDPEFSDPGCGAEVDFAVTVIYPEDGSISSLDDILDIEDFINVLIDHLKSLG